MLWFIASQCPEWESQLCHKENNWIGNVFSPGSRARGVCGGGRVLPFSPCVLLCSATVDSQSLSQQSTGGGSSLCHWDKRDPRGCETLEHVWRHPRHAEARHGQRIHVVLLSQCPCNCLQPPGRHREGLLAALLLPSALPPRLIPSPAL